MYSRKTHRHSISSLFSTEDSGAGLSFFSGISPAQIPSLSVISLPIFCHELWNAQQYEILQDAGTYARPIDEFTSEVRRLRDNTSSVEGSSLSPADPMIGAIGFKNGNLLKRLLKSHLKAKPTAKRVLERQTKIVLLVE